MKTKLFGILLVLLIVVVIGFVLNRMSSNEKELKILASNENIIKVEMKIVSDGRKEQIVVTEPVQLDSINKALQEAKAIKVQQGGLFDTWADIAIYKGNSKINMYIQHSRYNGWYIDLGSSTLKSEYMHELVRRLAEK